MKANYLLYLPLIAASSTVAGCSANNTGKTTDNTVQVTDTSNAPVETNPPNTNYPPAFVGQTRIKGVHTTTPYIVERIATGIGKPWAVVPMPGAKLLVTDKSGFMQIFNNDGSLVTKITGLPAVNSSGQGGLLDVALDPAFATNKTIYWTYAEKLGGGNITAVAKGVLNEGQGSVSNPVVIFRATPALNSAMHYGSRIVFDKEGYLFVSVGEKSILEGRKQAQWLNSGLGKIFRITTDGKPAPGNPFVQQKDAMPEIYSYGHRNPQGLDIHPATGELWESEMGPKGGDELNLVKPSINYGWPTITYGIEYNGNEIGDAIQKKEGMQQPVYYWDPVLSPSGMSFYSGNAIPEWKNNLFIGGLSSLHIARLVIENNKVVGEERLLVNEKERIRDVAEQDGKLFAVSDSGILFRIQKK